MSSTSTSSWLAIDLRRALGKRWPTWGSMTDGFPDLRANATTPTPGGSSRDLAYPLTDTLKRSSSHHPRSHLKITQLAARLITTLGGLNFYLVPRKTPGPPRPGATKTTSESPGRVLHHGGEGACSPGWWPYRAIAPRGPRFRQHQPVIRGAT